MVATACGGDGAAPESPTAARTATATRTAAPSTPAGQPTASPPAPTGAATPAAGATSPATLPAEPATGESPSVPPPVEATPEPAPSEPGAAEPGAPAPLGAEAARDGLSRAAILLGDLESGYDVNSDEYSTNDQAAQAPGAAADSAELFVRCGRVLGRVVSYVATNAQDMALAGRPVGYFSTVSAYESADGAKLCFDETLRLGATGEGGSLGRQFGDLFVDPDDVAVASVAFPSVGEQSLAFTISGDTLAEGNRVGIVILTVFFRQGQTTALVGAIKAFFPPGPRDLEALARLVAQRIQEEFGS